MTDAEWNGDGWTHHTRTVAGVTFKLSECEGLWHSRHGAVIGRTDEGNRNWALFDNHGTTHHDSCKKAMEHHAWDIEDREG